MLGQDYMRTARAKGLVERVIVLRHALRNALIPVVTILGLQVPAILGGSVVMETIFNLPHQSLCQVPPPVFGSDSDGGHVPGVIRLHQSNHEPSHHTARRNGAERY